jgi:hypothetical protein
MTDKHDADKPTPPRHPAGAAAPVDLKTAQESDQSGTVPGVGPVSPSEVSPGPVETIEEQDIGPRTPYPTGDPPPPAESRTYTQGIKGVTDKPQVKPGETTRGASDKGPAR